MIQRHWRAVRCRYQRKAFQVRIRLVLDGRGRSRHAGDRLKRGGVENLYDEELGAPCVPKSGRMWVFPDTLLDRTASSDCHLVRLRIASPQR